MLGEFGPAVLGAVARFHIEARTSLCHVSEVITRRLQLALYGLTVRGLRWPASVLDPYFIDDAATEDPELEARLAAGIAQWESEH